MKTSLKLVGNCPGNKKYRNQSFREGRMLWRWAHFFNNSQSGVYLLVIEVCGQEAKNSDFKPRSTVAKRQRKQHRAFGGDVGDNNESLSSVQ